MVSEILLICNLSPSFLFCTLEMLKLIIVVRSVISLSPYQLLSSFKFISDCRADQSSTRGTLNVNSVQVTLVILLQCYSVLERVSLWAFQYAFRLYVRFLSPMAILSFANPAQMLLTHRNLRCKLDFMPVCMSNRWNVALSCIGICPIIGKIIVVHRSIILFRLSYWSIQLFSHVKLRETFIQLIVITFT